MAVQRGVICRVTVLCAHIKHRQGDFGVNAKLSVRQGTTALFGRSGSGKSTIVHALAGLIRPEAGRISLHGRVLFDSEAGVFVPPHERRIGVVFQDSRLFPHMSVKDNLNYGARFNRAALDAAGRNRLIDLLGLGALLKASPETLSGGEKQRVALARALISGPEMVLMDEPLAGLDVPRKAQILPYLEHLCREGGPAIVYVSHDMNEVARLADDMAVVQAGEIRAQGALEQIMSDPAHVPLIGTQDAGSVLRGRIVAHTEDGLTEVRLGAQSILVPHVRGDVGMMVRLRLKAQDVMISLNAPEGLSALNALETVVETIREGQGPGYALGLKTGEDRFVVRLTARAMSQLQVREGQTVWAVFKASAVAPASISQARAEL